VHDNMVFHFSCPFPGHKHSSTRPSRVLRLSHKNSLLPDDEWISGKRNLY
jgi:hypothetical protein